MKKFKISEEQYNLAVQEGITLQADVEAANGNIERAVNNTKQQARANGINLGDATIAIDGDDVNENRVITIGELKRNILMEDKKRNSKLFTVGEFIRNFKKNQV